MIATAIVDGVSLDLLVDTGASDLLWLGEPGRDSDAVHRFLDAQGTLLDAFRGVSKISFAGGPARDLPVDRIPTWPYLEAKLAYLDKFRVGKKIRGLLGLSVLGAGQVLIDGHGGELRLEVQR
jgi:hypothetical protein